MKVSQMRLREQCSKYVFSYKLCNNHINVLYPRLCGRWPMLVLANYCITHAEWEVGRQRLSYANQEPTERGNATPLLGACARWPLPGLPPGPRALAPIRQRHIVWRHGDASGNSHKLFITGTDREHASVMDSHGHPRGHRVDC